jgi:hypothetical protein
MRSDLTPIEVMGWRLWKQSRLMSVSETTWWLIERVNAKNWLDSQQQYQPLEVHFPATPEGFTITQDMLPKMEKAA